MTKDPGGAGKRGVVLKAAGRAKVGSAMHILAAAKGPRTVSHQKIKKAVEKVLRERARADA